MNFFLINKEDEFMLNVEAYILPKIDKHVFICYNILDK